MSKTSVINWINKNDKKPLESGWYMVVLMPKNHEEFRKCPTDMNSWIKKFGINKLWWNNGHFWEDNFEVTDRVTHWALLPEVPLFK